MVCERNELRWMTSCGLLPGAHMATDPPKRADDITPNITPERAQELVREGEALARAYRQRIEKMWTIPKDVRQTRVR